MKNRAAHNLMMDWAEWYVRTFVSDGLGHQSSTVEARIGEARGVARVGGHIPRWIICRKDISAAHWAIMDAPAKLRRIAFLKYVAPGADAEKIASVRMSRSTYFRHSAELLEYVANRVPILAERMRLAG